MKTETPQTMKKLNKFNAKHINKICYIGTVLLLIIISTSL